MGWIWIWIFLLFSEHDSTLPPFLRRFTSISIAIYVLTEVVEIYQKLKMYQEAVDLLRLLLEQKTHKQDSRGRWVDRLALNLESHLKKPREVSLLIFLFLRRYCNELFMITGLT